MADPAGPPGSCADTHSSSNREDALPPDMLGHMFRCLDLPALGRVSAVCTRWRDASTLMAKPLWYSQAYRLGYLTGWSEQAATARALRCGDWKAYVRHECAHERLWCQPNGSALKARVLAAGHKHWVPSILMDPQSREVRLLCNAATPTAEPPREHAHGPRSCAVLVCTLRIVWRSRRPRVCFALPL